MLCHLEKCCCFPCKMHVETGALIIAIGGCLLKIGTAIYSFTPSTTTHTQNIALGITYLILALLYLSIILAQQKRIHQFYLPYLVVVALEIVSSLVLIVVFIIYMIIAPEWFVDEWNKQHPDQHIDRSILRLSYAILIVTFVVNAAVSAWLWSVVFRAYKFLKNEVTTTSPASYPRV